LQDSATDIRRHGIREPLDLLDGKLLDGRNRQIACKRLGIDHPTRAVSRPSTGENL
jgi:hypothetical protein